MNKISLEGALNVRDIGGYLNAEGKEVSKGKLYRSDNLDRVTPADIQKLKSLGINLDIDLRSPEEWDRWPDLLRDMPGIRYEKIPLLSTIDPEELPNNLAALYVYLLDHSQKEFAQIFRLILSNAEGVTLFHCSAGKDRTGLVTAMLLLLAGVNEKVIIEDYTESAENLKSVLAKFAEMNNPALRAFLTAREEDIRPFLNRLKEKYGGVEEYLKAIGLVEGEIDELRAMLIQR